MFCGKMKAVTFSYDDAVTQDQRLIALFNRYGLKATFNLNYEKLGVARSLIRQEVTVAHVKPRPCEIAGIYRGHEVAGHTLTHAHLPRLSDDEIVHEVEDDLKGLSALVGYDVVGSVYPCGDYDDRVVRVITERTSAKYVRTTKATKSFDLQTELIAFHPTVHHADWESLFELAHQFLEMKPESPKLFYIWGHAYEFDIDNSWDRMEALCRLIAGREDIFYGTNSEVLLGIDNYKKGI